VSDVYRPLNSMDVDDMNSYRGNKFQKLYQNGNGEFERDSLGRVKYVDVTDAEANNRRNYQKGNVVGNKDSDSVSNAIYNYGKSTLISDKSRVYKCGSWNDLPYWLSPGTRRFMEEDQSSSMVGFRCAMDRVGSQEGNGFRNGNHFGKTRQNSRK